MADGDVLSWLWTLLAVPITWLWHLTMKNRDELSRHKEQVAEKYARRDDMKDGFRAIQLALQRIEAKLDNKADKQ